MSNHYGNGIDGSGGCVLLLFIALVIAAGFYGCQPSAIADEMKPGRSATMPIDQPPAIVEQVKPSKRVTVHHAHNGWWAHIEGHGYPFGAWRMDSGPYPFKWMAELAFPIERWRSPEGPRR